MNWAAEQRQIFIRERLNETGRINRADIMAAFGIGLAQASIDLGIYKDTNPKAMFYDMREKVYKKKVKK